jgi:hypothetical protein
MLTTAERVNGCRNVNCPACSRTRPARSAALMSSSQRDPTACRAAATSPVPSEGGQQQELASRVRQMADARREEILQTAAQWQHGSEQQRQSRVPNDQRVVRVPFAHPDRHLKCAGMGTAARVISVSNG